MNSLQWAVALLAMATVATPCFSAGSSGTGFAVSPSKLVTNQHVVEGCTTVEIHTPSGKRQGTVVAVDEVVDLALVQAVGLTSSYASVRASEARLGERVMVFGYPLAGTLTTKGNFTDGLISGLRGIDEDASRLQFTAPVQPGNSGGPLLDGSGEVIGVVVAKFDAIKAAKVTGDIAQNLNFAVSLQVLRGFLEDQKVAIPKSTPRTRSAEEVARLAQTFTFRVICMRPDKPNVAAAPSPDKPAITAPEGPKPYFRHVYVLADRPLKVVDNTQLRVPLNTCIFTNDKSRSMGLRAGDGFWYKCQKAGHHIYGGFELRELLFQVDRESRKVPVFHKAGRDSVDLPLPPIGSAPLKFSIAFEDQNEPLFSESVRALRGTIFPSGRIQFDSANSPEPVVSAAPTLVDPQPVAPLQASTEWPRAKSPNIPSGDIVLVDTISKLRPPRVTQKLSVAGADMGTPTLTTNPVLYVPLDKCLFGKRIWQGATAYQAGIFTECNFSFADERNAYYSDVYRPSTVVITIDSKQKFYEINEREMTSLAVPLMEWPEGYRAFLAGQVLRIEIRNNFVRLLEPRGAWELKNLNPN